MINIINFMIYIIIIHNDYITIAIISAINPTSLISSLIVSKTESQYIVLLV